MLSKKYIREIVLEEIKIMFDILMKILKAELNGNMLDEQLKEQITPQIVAQLYQISEKHDVLHIIGIALKRNQLIQDESVLNLYMRNTHLIAMRMEWLIHEQNEIMDLFELEGIDYLPLKGAIIREYYPQPWLRTSSDIDILVCQEQLEQAIALLIEKKAYKVQRKNYHDIVLYSPNGVRLELHFSILEYDKKIDPVLEQVWQYAIPVQGTLHRYEMQPEYFMFHLVAHMYYHFVHGGCGIRFFGDLWLLKQNIKYDEKKLKTLCETCGLNIFLDYIWKMLVIWFEEEKHDEVTIAMERYVITGGLYGNEESKVIVSKLDTESRISYIWKRLFVPSNTLENLYPKLKKRIYLYPYYSIKRFWDAFKEGRLKGVSNELYLNKTIQKDKIENIKVLFEKLNIQN